MPQVMRKLVVLPAPFGPSRPTISPLSTRKSTPSTTPPRAVDLYQSFGFEHGKGSGVRDQGSGVRKKPLAASHVSRFPSGSHAPRGNLLCNVLRRVADAERLIAAFPRRAWERDCSSHQSHPAEIRKIGARNTVEIRKPVPGMGPVDEQCLADQQLAGHPIVFMVYSPQPPVLAHGAVVAEHEELIAAEWKIDILRFLRRRQFSAGPRIARPVREVVPRQVNAAIRVVIDVAKNAKMADRAPPPPPRPRRPAPSRRRRAWYCGAPGRSPGCRTKSGRRRSTAAVPHRNWRRGSCARLCRAHWLTPCGANRPCR